MNYSIIEFPQADPNIEYNDPALPATCEEIPVIGNPNWDSYSADPANRKQIYVDTAGTATLADILAECPWFKDAIASIIRAEGATRLSAVASPYLGEERDTWFIQDKEKDAYNLDNLAPTPFLSAMATARGISMADMVANIEANYNAFTVGCGTVAGTQQKHLDELYLATTTVDRMVELKDWPVA